MSTVDSTSAASLQSSYLTLLVTQLQNQDPTNPTDDSQMAGELAQFSQLQQMQTLNSSFDEVLQASQMSQATSLIGKEISFTPSGTTTPVQELVQGVDTSSGSIQVQAGGYEVGLSDIQSITDPSQTDYTA